jgi:hypothetical protein
MVRLIECGLKGLTPASAARLRKMYRIESLQRLHRCRNIVPVNDGADAVRAGVSICAPLVKKDHRKRRPHCLKRMDEGPFLTAKTIGMYYSRRQKCGMRNTERNSVSWKYAVLFRFGHV